MSKILHYFRYHWFDVALVLVVILGITLYVTKPEGMSLLLWLSLGSLFLHQIEEWRYPGYFPGMLNRSLFNSDIPDRYPLNANSGMLINVVLGWGGYVLAALYWQSALWLAIATILVSAGNIFAHTVIFNVKSKTLYNPGLLTSWLFFVPIVFVFFKFVIEQNMATPVDWILGFLLGFMLNYFGVFKMIIWLSDRQTLFVFPSRFLVPQHQKKSLLERISKYQWTQKRRVRAVYINLSYVLTMLFLPYAIIQSTLSGQEGVKEYVSFAMGPCIVPYLSLIVLAAVTCHLNKYFFTFVCSVAIALIGGFEIVQILQNSGQTPGTTTDLKWGAIVAPLIGGLFAAYHANKLKNKEFVVRDN